MKYTESKNQNNISLLFFSSKKNNRIGELEIFIDDNNKQWLNRVYLDEEYRPNGGAAKLFRFAQKKYGQIFISIADKGSHLRNKIANDFRYIEPPDGVRFVNNLFKHGILNKTDFKTPFPNEHMHWRKENFPFLFDI